MESSVTYFFEWLRGCLVLGPASDAALLATWDAVVVKGVWKTGDVASHRICCNLLFSHWLPRVMSPIKSLYIWLFLMDHSQSLNPGFLVLCLTGVACGILVVVIKECNFLLPPPQGEQNFFWDNPKRDNIVSSGEDMNRERSTVWRATHTHSEGVGLV